MPPDRSRTVNAQGRQKSCAECAKGKRKCDLGQPSCSRCCRQHLSCVYPPPPLQRNAASTNVPMYEVNDFDVPESSFDLENLEAETSLDFDVPTLPPVDFDLGAGITSLNALSNMIYSSPNEEDQMALERSYRHVINKSFSAAHIAPFAKSRTAWSIEQLKLAPKILIETNGTPWQHPMLYKDHIPQSIQDSYAACALYIVRNDTNQDFVARFIQDYAESLVHTPLPQEPTDVLARAHALMLYQNMLVFGGDVSLYSQAERLLPCLEEVGHALHNLTLQQVDLSGAIPLYPSAASRAAWTTYIFGESLRRTLLSVFHLITMCNLLRGQLTSCDDSLAIGTKLTISAHLWNAKTPLDFALAWNNQKHFMVKELDFTEVLRDAMPEDVCTLGRMMMIGLQGEDDIRGWFYTRGGAL